MVNCTCYYSSDGDKYCLWQPNTGFGKEEPKYTDLIKIPCDETYTKADFTFNYDWSWQNYSSGPNNTSKTFRNINIGTDYNLASYYDTNKGQVFLKIGIKKYNEYYTLSLSAYNVNSYNSYRVYLYALKNDSDDKTMFSCTLYN